MNSGSEEDRDAGSIRWGRARYILSVGSPPIEDGVMAWAGGRISFVGRFADFKSGHSGSGWDWGELAIVPGLVNAHVHLDYSGLAGCVPPPSNFVAWIEAIQAAKAARPASERARDWLEGARMLARGGVTTVGDIEAWPELLPQVRPHTPLRTVSYFELIQLQSGEDPLAPWRELLASAAGVAGDRWRPGLSPHAPYSTTPALLRACAQEVRARGWPVAIHVAESREEFEMFRHGRGPLKEWLAARGRVMSDLDGSSPVAAVERAGLLGPRCLVVHGNYLADGDAEKLARHGATVVHCPRSHAFFGHEPFPWETLRAAGVPVCIGTDSAATVPLEEGVPPLDLLVELAWLRRRHPHLVPEERLAMVTTVPARAMGLEGAVGQLRAGAWADFVLIPALGTARDTLAAWTEGALRPVAVAVGGRWVAGANRGAVA
ncbi:MAG: hypothetical protein D6766_13270 [Verrucomicrobia bacterium]|nr:MAG: hypothetical protein D6766_13270 [Verrucomicrobiota bacterium]